MVYEQVTERQYVIRIPRGDDLMSSLENFCLQERIKGAFFTGIGAVDLVELAHYNVDTQKYSSTEFNQALEVTNLTGNVATHENDLIIHAHGTFSDTDMKCLGGHIVNCTVSGTLEIFLTETTPLTKSEDSNTGLKLLDLSNQI